MADRFHQPPVPRPTAARPERAGSVPLSVRRLIHRLSCVLRPPTGLPGLLGNGLDPAGQGLRGHDVLWRAKCNALHRALADHDLTPHQARAILCRLSAARNHGCELAGLERLTGVDAGVLDRAVPLLGLQTFVTVSETSPRGCTRPVLWVFVTEHGLRYAAEAFAAPVPGVHTAMSGELP